MNSLPVEYFAIQDSNGNIDFDSFRSFVDNHVRTWRDVESVCLYCDLDDDKLRYMQQTYCLPKSVFRKFKDRIDWSGCVEYYKFNDAFVEEMKEYVDWASVVMLSKKVTEDCLRHNVDRISFMVLSGTRVMSLDFMDEFKERMCWEEVTRLWISRCRLTNEFLDRFKGFLDWRLISQYGQLSAEQLERYGDLIDWRTLSVWRSWTSDELNRFFDMIDWDAIERIGNFHMTSSFIDRIKMRLIFCHE